MYNLQNKMANLVLLQFLNFLKIYIIFIYNFLIIIYLMILYLLIFIVIYLNLFIKVKNQFNLKKYYVIQYHYNRYFYYSLLN